MIWLHYVGKKNRFLQNALTQGVTRRVSPQDARRMEFGDRVVLACWNKGEPYMFAEFTINQVLLQNETAQETTSQLRMCGMAAPMGGDPVHVEKECGEFTIESGCVVTCNMSEIVNSAMYIAGLVDERLWFMVGGSITALYNNIYLNPQYKKVQGFTELGIEDPRTLEDVPHVLLEVQGYTTS